MIHSTEYVRAKKIVDQYDKERLEQKQSVICTLKNLELRRGDDGHWLTFKTLAGNSGVLNVENCFPEDNNSIVSSAVRQWAKEQLPL